MNRRFITDAVILALGVAVGAFVLVRLDALDVFYNFTRAHESWELDEVILSVPLLALGLFIYALRRLGELRREVSKRREAEQRAMAAEDEARRMRKLKEEFMSVAGHELRSPLNSIHVMLQGLLLGGLSEEEKENMSLALASVKSMDALLDDVLAFSRLERGDAASIKVRFDPAQLVRSAHQSLLILAQTKGLDMPEPDTTGLPDRLVGPEGPIRQIVFNLLSNAVKYTKQGTISLTAGLLHTANGDGTLAVEVSDTGPGIPEDMRERIFKPYVQLGESPGEQGGVGLGLSLVKRLVEFTGGTITVDSGPGRGSRFRALVPVSLLAPGLDKEP